MRDFLLLGLTLPGVWATTSVHFFAHTSCNAGTSLSDYTSTAATSADSVCHEAPNGTEAIYVDGIDDGCSLRAFSDASCTLVSGISIEEGQCYYPSSSTATPVGSWQAICPGEVDPLANMTSSKSATDMTSSTGMSTMSSMSMTDSQTSTVAMTTGAEPTSILMPTMTAPANSSMIWSVSHTSGKMDTGSATAQVSSGFTSGAEAVVPSPWKKSLLKGLTMMAAVEGLWALA